MKVKKVSKLYHIEPKQKFNNNWETSKYMFAQPCLHAIIGCRGSGKSHLVSKIIRAGNAEGLYDIIYFISPSRS